MNRSPRRTTLLAALCAAICTTLASAFAQDSVWLSSLDLTRMHQGWGDAQRDLSVAKKPLSIGGRLFKRGVGTHATSILWLDLAAGAERFSASVGVDDSAGGPGTVKFKILGDGRILYQSGVMKRGQGAGDIDIDLRGVKQLVIKVSDAGDGNRFDFADWGDARFIVRGDRPKSIDPPREEEVILTPGAGKAPRINGPTLYGCRSGNPFLYRIPCTGERPVVFAADRLPASLKLDAQTGIITGTAPGKGEYLLTLRAKNRHAVAVRRLRIISGDMLALTPPMGWNHWYAHYGRITDVLVREAADVMISSGMADAGYQYVDIDDCWMDSPKNDDSLRVGPLRDGSGNIVPNKHFPDMNALTAYIHGKGLKAGIYTSPGPLTCAGFAGSFGHEGLDARQFAEWGFDFLKYDWCSYGNIAGGDNSREAFMRPYKLMGDMLKVQKRDIVFNLCQYGMGNVWEWGAEVGAHCWRTAGDLGYELDRVFEVALKNAEHRAWSRPGAWNDPDYIQIGYIGDARRGGIPAPCTMGPSEQYAFMSLWCLMASPLFFSGDMGRLDRFTLNVLCNPEVIEVDQDPLGQSAAPAILTDETFLMVKDLEDGSKAVGLFNRGEFPARVTAPWALLGLAGKQSVRDLWRQKECGTVEGEFTAAVPRHGVVLVRLRPANKDPK